MTASAKYYSNVEYGRAGGSSLQLDAQIPEGPGPFPAAIIVHGGAWVTGDRKSSVQPLFTPLAGADFAWFSISYRLANLMDSGSLPSAIASLTTLGAATDDVRQAVTYVKAHAREYNVDPNRIALVGESAGGQLASMAALKPELNSVVRAVVALYTPSDLADLIQTSNRIPDTVRQALRGTPFQDLLIAQLRDLSPITWVRKDSPPFLLIHGTDDRLVPFSQSLAMCDTMRNAGAGCDVYAVKGGGHGIRWWESNPGLTGYKLRMIDWLKEKLGSAGTAQ